jgi:hypothetical protein
MSRRRGAQEYARQSRPKTQTVLQNWRENISRYLPFCTPKTFQLVLSGTETVIALSHDWRIVADGSCAKLSLADGAA